MFVAEVKRGLHPIRMGKSRVWDSPKSRPLIVRRIGVLSDATWASAHLIGLRA